MTRTHHARYGIDLDGLIYVEDVPCDFKIEITVSQLEPYSWGQSRGTEVEIEATLESLKLGGMTLTAKQAEEVFGPEAIARAEAVAEDRYHEERED
jgi:hypothetical protein